MKYNAETENGIPYVRNLYINDFAYKTVVDDLDSLYPTRRSALVDGNVKSYSIGSRSVSRSVLSAREVLKLWDKLMSEKARLEQGRNKRRALGVVFRDW